MKRISLGSGESLASRGSMGRLVVVALFSLPLVALAQRTDPALRNRADALFEEGRYATAMPLYSQLVSLDPTDRELSYKFGACTLYGDADKSKSIGFLRYAVNGPTTIGAAWYFLGRAYQLNYRFGEAIDAYVHFRGTAEKKQLSRFPVDLYEQQCRNGKNLLNNLKDIKVYSKVEVDADDFFRFYDLSDIGGKVVTTPEELLTALDRKSDERSLVYVPTVPGPFYFSSYGKDGRTGLDIYRTQLLPTGGFAEPVKLSSAINTDQDEGYGVMAADGKSFYFSSKGHNSMGGYDVFMSTYDKRSDSFSPAVNMDFAVNTPADELLYIVGPDGQQACFSSTRDSKQGMVNVYRVGTSQAPLDIVVLKGVYSSEADTSDHAAHITVFDVITQKKVAEVGTEVDGSYLVALPRGGKYQFQVVSGKEKLTRSATVDVPGENAPVAYAQEIMYSGSGGGSVAITDHFDRPLEEDVMSLAMAEILRRAKLDVTDEAPSAAERPRPTDDLMAEAGFDGTMTRQDALALATKMANEATKEATELEVQADVTSNMAMQQVAIAEAQADLARSLTLKAEASPTEMEKGEMMRQAAKALQRSKDAAERARIAQLATETMDRSRNADQHDAEELHVLGQQLDQGMRSKDRAATLQALLGLKEISDQIKGPEQELTPIEQMRRTVADAEKVAESKLQQAKGDRREETEASERLTRLKTGLPQAKGRKKEELDLEIARLTTEQEALHEETEAAFAKARKAEEEAQLARGQFSLMTYLAANNVQPAQRPDMEEIAQLQPRIKVVDDRNAAMKIDARYDLYANEPAGAKERRIQGWDMSATDAALAEITDRSTEHADTLSAQAIQEPVLETRPNQEVKDDGQVPTSGIADLTPLVIEQSDVLPDVVNIETGAEQTTSSQETIDTSAETSDAPIAGGTEALPEEEQIFFLSNQLAELGQERSKERDKHKVEVLEVRMDSIRQRMQVLQEKSNALDATHTAQYFLQYVLLDFDPMIVDERLIEELVPGFVLNRSRIMQGNGSPVQKATALRAMELQLIDSIDAHVARYQAFVISYPDQAAMAVPRIDRLRALRDVHEGYAQEALATMLGDTVQTATTLEEQALLPTSKEQDVVEGPDMRRTDNGTIRPAGTSAEITVESRLTPTEEGGPPSEIPRLALGAWPKFDDMPEHHAPKAAKAVADLRQELDRMEQFQSEIAALQREIAITPPGQDQADQRQRLERTLSDLANIQANIEQRVAFINNEDLAAASDSATKLAQLVKVRGMVADQGEVDAQLMTDSAAKNMKVASLLRNTADRTLDSAIRDSLYRSAYTAEMEALDQMDRSIDLRASMLSNVALADATSTEPRNGAIVPPAATDVTDLPAVGKNEVKTTIPRPTIPVGNLNTEETSGAVANSPVDERQHAEAYLDQLESLTPSERNTALSEAGPERYFGLKGSAMEQQAIADTLSAQGLAQAHQAEVLRQEAAGSLAASGGVATNAEQRSQIEKLQSRAVQLEQQADSSRTMALRQAAAATTTETLAENFLVTLPAEQVTSIQQLEQRGKQADLAQTIPDMGSLPSTKSETLPDLPQVTAPASETETEEGTIAQSVEKPNTTDGPVIVKSTVSSGTTPIPSAEKPIPPTSSEAKPKAEEPQVDRPEGTPSETAPPVVVRSTVSSGTAPTPATEEQAKPTTTPEVQPSTVEPQVARSEGTGTDADLPSIVKSTVTSTTTPIRSADDLARMTPVATERSPLSRSAPLIVNRFTLGKVAPRTVAIPIDTVMASGLVFKVQVGAFKQTLPKGSFGDLDPVVGEHASNGFTRYMAGLFTALPDATSARDLVRGRGYKDAFVVAYLDGKRISIQQARAYVPQEQETSAVAAVLPPTTVPAPTPTPIPTPTPTPTPQPVVPPVQQAVSTKQPATAEEVLAEFRPEATATAYYNDSTAAPATQVESVKGLFFTVQVGVYSKPTALDKLFDITPLNSEFTATGKIRYTTGIYRDLDQARERKDASVLLGVTDAFITAYLNGRRIPLGEARTLLDRFGEAILVDPALGTR